MVVAIICGVLAVLAFCTGAVEVGIILSVACVVCLVVFAKPTGEPPRPEKGSQKPIFQGNEEANFETLYNNIIRFVDTRACNFDYLLIQRRNSLTRKAPMGLPDMKDYCNYIPGECVAAVFSDGSVLSYNFKLNGGFELSDKSRAHLAYRLKEHYNGMSLIFEEDVAGYSKPSLYSQISPSSYDAPTYKFVPDSCYVLSVRGKSKHEAEIARRKAEKNSVKHC